MPDDTLSTTFAALADPTRRAILARLAEGAASVTELAEPFAMSMPAISKHLKVLERAGLIERGRDAQWRPCKLKVGPLQLAAQWLGGYRRFWEESFDRLDDYLQQIQSAIESTNQAPSAPVTPQTAGDIPTHASKHMPSGAQAAAESTHHSDTHSEKEHDNSSQINQPDPNHDRPQ